MANISTQNKNLEKGNLKRIKIALLSSFTLLGFERAIKDVAQKYSVDAEIYTGEYGQHEQEILNPESNFYKFGPEAVFLFLDTRTIVGDFFYGLGDWRFLAEASGKILNLAKALERTRAKIIIHNFEVPYYSPFGILENKQEAGLVEKVERLNDWLRNEFKKSDSIFVFDYNGFVSKFGKKEVFDPKMYYLGDARVAFKHLPALAEEYIAYLKPLLGLSKKCIVLDLDNTLWGGVLGEEGLGGIKLGPTSEGRPFWEFQKLLLALSKRGVMLALNSKNNPADVKEVFEKHPHMVLKSDHFLAERINWQDKVYNMKSLAEELNVGLDSFVFFDDDKTNRELVKKILPEILVPDLPEDPALYPETLMSLLGEFNLLQFTDEDKKRGEMYVAEKKRKILQSSVKDIVSFLKSLNLKVEVLTANKMTVPRIAQLTQKTNQFNMTTRRHTEEAIWKMAKSKDYLLKCFRIEDNFGDYGTTGVLVIKKNGKNWLIEDFLLSCRILGKEIEFAVMNYLINEARERGVDRIFGRFVPTSKNEPARDFYQKFGFVKIGEKKNGEIEYLLNPLPKRAQGGKFVKVRNK